ncbi:MAG: ORF6N domain-containing protein [Bacteroidales bacterium]
MATKDPEIVIPDEVIMNKIYLIRGKKVMLDRDLAELYGVETKVLKQTVRRNFKRFPPDFMFEMTTEELQNWRSQFVTSNADKKGLRYSPFCFTEHGVIMLASILNTDRAININVQIVRIFIKMREMLASHKEILHRLEKIEHKLAENDDQILLIFEYLKQLEQTKLQELDQQNRKRIGYKRKNEQ